jgi:hypothetical protein
MKKMAIIIKKNKIMKNRKFILFFLDFSKCSLPAADEAWSSSPLAGRTSVRKIADFFLIAIADLHARKKIASASTSSTQKL